MKKFLSIAVLLMLTACSTVSVRHSDKMPPIKPTVTGTNHFFIGGIGQENIIDAKEICGDRGYSFNTYYSFGDGLLTFFTFGIYTPSSYKIYCDKIQK